mmetsp:Transcript_8829/g.13152  ORF Transcript_8829/g.13152 Transcript_8829/m.13152 type:complete len:121 (-) Transcript_8829:54-416(-)
MEESKASNFLEKNGLVEAYEYLLTSLIEHGLPTGDLYEFAALMVLKFEKKWKQKQRIQGNKAKRTDTSAEPKKEESKAEDNPPKPEQTKPEQTKKANPTPQPKPSKASPQKPTKETSRKK